MPVQRCTFEGKPAWRYGGSGKPYTFNADDPESEKRAKQKAIDQGLAMTDGKLEKGDKKTDTQKIELIVGDPENNILDLLKYIQSLAGIGHTFDVLIDPGDEYEKKFEIDGDGSDHIRTIFLSESYDPGAVLEKTAFGYEGPDDMDIAHSRLIDEANGASSYQNAADQAKDPQLKKLLTELSAAELEHTKKLTAYIESHRPTPKEAEESAAEKSAPPLPKRIVVPIAKVIGDVVYGVVVHANKADLQGDIMSPADIRKAMHQFMAESRKINKDHSEDIDACPVECWQATEKGFLGSSEYAPGDWLMGTKILDPNELAKARAGDYRSYSIEGFGVRVPTDS